MRSFDRYLAPDAAGALSDREAFLVRTRLMHLFRGFAQLDPELPEELAPLAAPRTRGAAGDLSGLAVPRTIEVGGGVGGGGTAIDVRSRPQEPDCVGPRECG